MKKGYNNVPRDWKKLFAKSEYRAPYASYLAQLGPKNNVQRFPGGQEDINNQEVLEADYIQKLIDECKAGQVEEVILKANFHDLNGSVLAYKMITEAGIEVPWVEASNEPYMGRNVAYDFDNNMVLYNKAKIKRFFFWKVFDNNEYYRLLGERYGNRVNTLNTYFKNSGYDIKHKMSLAMPFPKRDTHKWKVFYLEVLKNVRMDDFGAISYHYYGNPEKRSTFAKTKEAWEKFHPPFKDTLISEWAEIDWGTHGNTDYVEHYMEPLQTEMKEEALEWFESIGVTHAIRHSGVGFDYRRLFSEFCFLDREGTFIVRTA